LKTSSLKEQSSPQNSLNLFDGKKARRPPAGQVWAGAARQADYQPAHSDDYPFQAPALVALLRERLRAYFGADVADIR